ncbi:MAG: transposase [Xanthomonadaceae bacterium]|nr:transposase [Xanthomonadaceae bacterium]
MEIITGVERRRRWRPEEKLRILAELAEPGTTVAEVARRHDLSRGLLWQWRAAQQRGELVVSDAAFLPMRMVAELPAPEFAAAPQVDPVPAEADQRIEIVLPDGTALRVPQRVDSAALRRVLAALRG